MRAFRDTRSRQTVLVDEDYEKKLAEMIHRVETYERWIEISVDEAMRTPEAGRFLRKFVKGSGAAHPVDIDGEADEEVLDTSKAAELSTYSEAELAELASDLKIKGRSKMDRAQLIDAIAAHMAGTGE